MRRIRIKKKSKRKFRIKRRNAPSRAAASRVRVRKPRRGKSLSKATRSLRTQPRKGRKIVVRKRQRSVSRRSVTTKSKRSKVEINVFGAEGYQTVVGPTSRQARLASRHLNAINRFLGKTGDTEALRPFQGKRIAGIELLTDPRRLREFADADEVKVDGLYRDQRGHARRR